jgi:hypothetical protein
MKIVAIMGAAKAGKSTVAEVFETLGATKMRFAGPLKEMLAVLGLSKDDLEGATKETPNLLLCGKTPRHAMQTLGTEWRDMIDTQLWTAILRKRLLALKSQEKPPGIVFIDDCRFPHEIEMLRSIGAEIWLVRRPAVEPPHSEMLLSRFKLGRLLLRLMFTKPLHLSEVYWFDAEVDRELFNNGTVAELQADVRYEINDLLRRVL